MQEVDDDWESFSWDEEKSVFTDQELAWDFVYKLLLPGTNAKVEKEAKLENFLKVTNWESFYELGDDFRLDLIRQLRQMRKKLKESIHLRNLGEKKIIGLGGKFSAGKSSFINSLLDVNEVTLPESTDPTTSLPTYILTGKADENIILTKTGSAVEIKKDELQVLTHEFTKHYDLDCSNFLHRVLVFSKLWQYNNIALLDTPGYSKPDTDVVEQNNDREKARRELAAADYIFWLMDAESGMITQSDINFLASLGTVKPIMFIFNKADLRTGKDMEKVIEETRKELRKHELMVKDVVAYTSLSEDMYECDNKMRQILQNGRKQIIAFLNLVNEEKGTNIDEEILSFVGKLQEKMDSKKRYLQEKRNIIRKNLLNIVYPQNCKSIISLYCYYDRQFVLLQKGSTALEKKRKELDDILKREICKGSR